MFDLSAATSADEVQYGGKTLAERITGRFYTPHVLADQLALRMLSAYRGLTGCHPVRIVDPFCGDGQLLASLLQQLAADDRFRAAELLVSGWDRDEAAVEKAAAQLRELTRRLALRATVHIWVGDTFSKPPASEHDFVITNPPWELLKPDSREMAHMTADEARRYREQLRFLSDDLDVKFPAARAANAWGGWATNLARCGWDLSMQLLNARGVLGIVLPSTLLADQSSEAIREAAFTRCKLVDLSAYPPEARLFDRVDQPVVAATFVAGNGGRTPGKLRVFDANRRERDVFPLPSTTALKAAGYSIPVSFGAGSAEIFDQLAALPELASFEAPGPEGLWLGRELDETRIHEKIGPGGKYPFIKGRMLKRHAVTEQPSMSVHQDFASRIKSARFHRAVWRDVSRSSQKRRMIGAVIPPGWIAGNSLHVAHFRDGDLRRTLALHAVLSSFVLEFQVRSRLATGHMSLGVVRKARVPELKACTVELLSDALDGLDPTEPCSAAKLEVTVAKAYGLDRNSFEAIIDCFEKVDDAERRELLSSRHWGEVGAA